LIVSWQQHLEDKQLSKFMEAEAFGIPSSGVRIDTKGSTDGASMGAAK